MTGAPLCIDCGKNPQPARRDGEPGTHHRCDPCARVWLASRTRRRALLDGEWCYAARSSARGARACGTCSRSVPPQEWAFRLGHDPDNGAPVLCWGCAVGSGYVDALSSAAPERPVLRAARLSAFVAEPADIPPFMGVAVPPAMPAVAALALHFLRRCVDVGVAGAVFADRRASDLTVSFSAGADMRYETRIAFTGAAGVLLTTTARGVAVPREIYKAVRTFVYDHAGKAAAKRLHRETPNEADGFGVGVGSDIGVGVDM